MENDKLDMSANDYQKRAFEFASYGDNPTYAYAGLAEEAGEVLGKFAKFIRKHEGLSPHECADWTTMQADIEKFKSDIAKELGDVLWMVAAIATENGLDLGGIMELNIAKLADRKNRGVIVGEGDNR